MYIYIYRERERHIIHTYGSRPPVTKYANGVEMERRGLVLYERVIACLSSVTRMQHMRMHYHVQMRRCTDAHAHPYKPNYRTVLVQVCISTHKHISQQSS